ncbi:urate oxidase [Nocardioides sp. GY 10113]|uniref:factor-independent urate hydroxylase n=1 Tax=Nocardioides sp. GY 10113 TaxID=2569761 RepID=UPI0010A7A245|nr:urate oxidase [Nocardioides sp. GY 10113]TIC89135.1 urate oxidase [Nocardioides sp. GY 10113]
MTAPTTSTAGIRLGANQYGKAENRVVRIVRDTPRHEIHDFNVSTSLRGDFTAAHTVGDQSAVLPTDTQKNTAFALAKEHATGAVEEYAIAIGTRLLEATPAAEEARIAVEQYAWERIGDHDHAFVRSGRGVRTTVVEMGPAGVSVVSGIKDLVILKSTGSEFRGFLVDEFTTLEEADDRILATSLVATWRYAATTGAGSVDWEAAYSSVVETVLGTFADHYSKALQQTLFAMGSAVLEKHPEIAEISFAAPNKHHFLYDLDRFGIANDGEVFYAADRPYGLIEATVVRE